MLTKQQIHDEWVQHPTGTIQPGTFCEHCNRYNTRNSTTCVMTVNSEGKLLMILRKRDPQAGWWGLPGGYSDWNETLEQCALRELKEEVGITADSAEFFGLYDDPARDPDGRQNIEHAYVVRVGSAQTHPDEHEVSEVKWFGEKELPENIAFDHHRIITEYFVKERRRHAR